MSMKNLHQLLLERNATETDPFVAVHAANAALYVQLDALQLKCELLEREQHVLDSNNNSSSAALRNETRLRDKLERLQEELNDKLREHQKDTAQALETAKSLAQLKDTNATNQKSLQKMQQELDKKEKAILHLQQQVDDAKQTTKLAEKQYNGLKETIRSLQNENDVLRDENRKLIDRVVSEKEKTSDEINILNEMVDKLKREVDMLRTLHIQEEQRKSWFGKPKPHGDHTTHDAKASPSTNNDTASPTRKFGTLGAVVPTAIQHTLSAHTGDATCVKYDSTGFDLLVTCGTDGLVKVWDTSTTLLKATLRGSPHSAVTACDMGGGLVVGGGSDKMGRVWNLKTQRMIHQLVGHANKITCVRLFGSERAVLTGSADRSLKIWDISRSTYRQTTTLRHSSTSYCVDVASDSFTTVSGHMDGGLRFWDARTGERTTDIESLHQGGVTSVNFHPSIATQVLTNGKDHSLKLLDLRTGLPLCTMRHEGFRTSYPWSACTFSPDGKYAAAVSGTIGQLFVWRLSDGGLEKHVEGHNVGAGGVAWGSGGTSGQQVASVDRTGKLILWA